MMKVIQDLNADILTLEEVSYSKVSAKRLETDLTQIGYTEILFCSASNIFGAPFGNLIAVKNIKVVGQGQIKLSDRTEGRCAVYMDIILNKTQIRVSVHI